MIVALLTDFGTSDYFVAAVKGSILTVDPSAVIIDITHDISPHDIRSAAVVLAACYRDFPPETIFTVVVDPGVGSSRRAIAVSCKDLIFVAPDNGVLSRVLGDAEYKAFELTNQRYFGPRRSSTFHGRDIFGPVSAHIALGVPLSELGPPAHDLSMLEFRRPRSSGGFLIAEITNIDRFGNIVTDLLPSDIPAQFELSINGHKVILIKDSYADAGPNELFLIVGSSGFVEVSMQGSSAAAMTGGAIGQELSLSSPIRSDFPE
ncbi:MAG: SAM-dependent chlorinase/fluorinase [Acidobacteriota bacterium]